MSVLSPVAIAILSKLQSTTKPEDTAGDAFLNLLQSGGEQQLPMSGDTDQDLIDSLYAAQDEQPPADVPVQVPTSLFVDNKQSAYRPKSSEPEKVVKGAAAQDNAPSDTEKLPAVNKETTQARPAPEEVRQSAPAVNQQTGAPENDEKMVQHTAGNAAPTDAISIADKLRSKIKELSDILSLLAGMAGASGVSQFTIVQVTQQTTISFSQQTVQGAQQLLDLSDRFDQLIAAISASQNLPPAANNTLQASFSAFKSLVFSFLGTPDAKPVSADMQLAALDTAQSSLDMLVQALAPANVTSGKTPISDMQSQLQKLQSWLNSFQSLVPQQPEQQAATQQAVYNNSGVVQSNEAFQTLDATALSKIFLAPAMPANDSTALPNSAVSVAAPVNTAPVQVSQLASAAAPVAVAADAITQGAGGMGANLSQGESGGQQGGGERGFTAGAASATGASGASTLAAPSATATFSKALKAASYAPVAEQVVFNIKTAFKNGDTKIQIHLDPVELGKLHIKMDISNDGKASNIVITADNRATLELLQRDMRGLESALSDAGIKTDAGSLSFNLRGGDQGQDEAYQQARTSYTPLLQEEDELAPLAVISRSYVVNLAEGLDIEI